MHTEKKYVNYSCHSAKFREGEQFVDLHSLGMILSGEMELNDGLQRTVFKKGEVFYMRKNQLMKYVKKPSEKEEFKSISIQFDNEILNNFSVANKITSDNKPSFKSFIKITSAPLLNYFMESLLQYQELLSNNAPELLELKQREALMLLLAYDANLKDALFDFSALHKINLEEFMNKNYHFNVKIERFAQLTGRSLATFKRDFQKIFQTSPRQWLQQRRLQEAYFLIDKKNKKPSEIYLDLGFEDLSHFSFSFKKIFGVTPTELIKS